MQQQDPSQGQSDSWTSPGWRQVAWFVWKAITVHDNLCVWQWKSHFDREGQPPLQRVSNWSVCLSQVSVLLSMETGLCVCVCVFPFLKEKAIWNPRQQSKKGPFPPPHLHPSRNGTLQLIPQINLSWEERLLKLYGGPPCVHFLNMWGAVHPIWFSVNQRISVGAGCQQMTVNCSTALWFYISLSLSFSLVSSFLCFFWAFCCDGYISMSTILT